MPHTENGPSPSTDVEFERLVDQLYRPLYRFACSLTRSEADACDLVQQTFYIWGAKGRQLQDRSKVKAWLFTTLHHEFLNAQRRQTRFPHVELAEADPELPLVPPEDLNRLDTGKVLEALARLDTAYRGPVALFYLEDHSYKQIAEVLGLPIGTVKSRLSRGIAHLQQLLLDPTPADRLAAGGRP